MLIGDARVSKTDGSQSLDPLGLATAGPLVGTGLTGRKAARTLESLCFAGSRSRAQVLALVCALVASVGTSLVEAPTHAHTGSDAPAYVEHDASAHRVEGAGSTAQSPQPQCLVCQWARSGWTPPVRVSHHAPHVAAVRLGVCAAETVRQL